MNELHKNPEQIMLNPKHIYVILAADNTVKVGITSNLRKRLTAIQTSSGKKIIDFYFTKACSNASEIENETKKNFKEANILGEWFSCPFNSMVDFVKSKYTQIAKHIYMSVEEYEAKNNMMVEFAKSISKKYSIENQDVFFNATKLILFYLWTYKQKLKEHGYDYRSEEIAECIELLKNFFLDIPEYFNEDQYEYISNINNICMELYEKNDSERVC